jgi:hypothetical protein
MDVGNDTTTSNGSLYGTGVESQNGACYEKVLSPHEQQKRRTKLALA